MPAPCLAAFGERYLEVDGMFRRRSPLLALNNACAWIHLGNMTNGEMEYLLVS